jgi:hypothetical protein
LPIVAAMITPGRPGRTEDVPPVAASIANPRSCLCSLRVQLGQTAA